MLAPKRRSPLAAAIGIASLLLVCQFGVVENKSICGIGRRVRGDQLLMKDALESRLAGDGLHQEVYFNYDIPQPITHIQIEAIENIQAEVQFLYQEDLIHGHVTAVNESPSTPSPPFTISIEIHGLNETLRKADSRYILNQNQHFKRHILPQLKEFGEQANAEDYGDEDENEEDPEEEEAVTDTVTHMEMAAETPTLLDISDYDYEEEGDDDGEDGDGNLQDGIEDVDEDAYKLTDANIKVGERQEGDYLLYQTDLISSSKLPGESIPTVVFYYIDSNFITFVEFTINDHYVDNWSGGSSKTPTVEYSHLSAKTLKAVIIDYQKPSMFAKMSVYGYKPADIPVERYVSFLDSMVGEANVHTEAPGESPSESRWPFLRSRLNNDYAPTAAGDAEALNLSTGGGRDGGGDALKTANGSDGAATCRPCSLLVYVISILCASLMVTLANYD